MAPGRDLVPNKLIGISPDVRGNGTFLDETHILYVCEKTLMKYNLKNRTSEVKISTVMKGRNIKSFAINNKKNLIGLGMDGPEALVSLYEEVGGSLVKKNDVRFTGEVGGSVTFVDFSAGSNFVAAIVGEPRRLCVYSLRRRAVVLNLRFTHCHGRATKFLRQVHFNPRNDKVLLLVGDGVLRTYRFQVTVKAQDCEVRFRTIGFRGNLPVVSACWYDSDRVLAGTLDGRLLILENSDIKGIYFINHLHSVYVPVRPPNIKVRECINWVKVAHEKLNGQSSTRNQISQVGFFEKGFIVGGRKVFIFEEPVNKPRWFMRTKVLDLDAQTVPPVLLNVHSHPRGRLVTCCTESKDIHFFDLNKSPVQDEVLENVSAGSESISSLSTCLWRPVCLSLSGQGLTLWNYETGNVINTWTFQERALDVCLHPTGSMLCLTLESALCIFSIEHDHNFVHQYRSCELNLHVFYEEFFTHCAFSDAGAYFGGATTNMMFIFSSTSFKILNVLQVQSLLIQSVIDDLNDTVTSVGSDGTKLRYNLQTGKLLSKSKLGEQEDYTEFAKDNQREMLYAVTSDGILAKVNFSDISKAPRAYRMDLGRLGALTISQASRILYLGIGSGAVVLVRLSQFDTSGGNDLSHEQHFLQSRGITKMIVTPTNKLITGNEEGCLCVYDILGATCSEYVCPHASTDLLIGSFSLLRFISAVRRLNEETLRDWTNIKEFMINDRFMKWVDVNYSVIMDSINTVESKLKEIDELRAFYNTVWDKMDSFWAPQALREADVYNHYLFYSAQFRDKENYIFDGWTRGLWHLEHVDTASKELSLVLDDVMQEMFNQKTIQERYIETYKSVQQDTVEKMQEVRKKVDEASQVYLKLYRLSRNASNGLQNFIMQEANHDNITTFDKDVLKRQYHTFITPFQEDIKILNKIYQKFLDDVKIKAKEIVDLTYLDNGPTGITMKLLPNIMTSKYEMAKLKEAKAADLCQYLWSQPAQWRELQRWDWVMREWSSIYHEWIMLGQANFPNAFLNSHAYHALRDEEKLKHLNKKQLSLIHNCSSNYVTTTRTLKVVQQFHFECVKIQNVTQIKLSKINDRLSEIPMEELFKELMDTYDTINKPNKIQKDVFFLKEKVQEDMKKTSRTEFEHVCPVSQFLPKTHKLRKELKTRRLYNSRHCAC